MTIPPTNHENSTVPTVPGSRTGGFPGGPVPVPPSNPTPAPSKHSGLARIALIVGIVGFVFGCIPGALIVGWVLLPVAFILGIIVAVKPGKKLFGIVAIILSIVGGIVSAFVFVSAVATAVNDALDDVTPTPIPSVVEPAKVGSETPTPSDDSEGDASGGVGTRENPLQVGATITAKDWNVVINGVNTEANAEVEAASLINSAPKEGSKYIVVNLTATYTGADSSLDSLVSVAFVTATGQVIASYEAIAVAPEPAFGLTELYSGGASTGNIVLEIPADADGLLRITPGILADEVFVAIS